MTHQPPPSAFHAMLTHHQGRALLQEIWEHFPEHMFLIRVETPQHFVVEAVNPSQQATIGYPCVGLAIEQLLPNPEQARSVIGHYRECLACNRPIRYEETGHFHKVNDEPLQWLTLLVPLHDEQGRTTHLFGISQNVTELRLARQALEEQNARLEALVEDRTAELRATNARLEELASRDELTGIANRRQLIALTEHAMQRARRQQVPLALLILDIDGFKAVNDTQGHLAGDAILREVAQTLAENLRESDLPGRFGGDEFVAVLARHTRRRRMAPGGAPARDGGPALRLHYRPGHRRFHAPRRLHLAGGARRSRPAARQAVPWRLTLSPCPEDTRRPVSPTYAPAVGSRRHREWPTASRNPPASRSPCRWPRSGRVCAGYRR
ncbi:diguanylate cyclase [Halomonas sp. LR5S13]|uniref:sensor domain-containing diguanylate cyclase n=1 Tax=Halomonas rhizosphaerae TaxID=3043296 RepID=UPI0024A8149A|nr:sensor domain-containing diguanylate cyclase [Halomonas rhizosphaerae]MDI5922778.1 diguanylate cyclase [Halomonas rhizosphaerae]